jgi:hypothetical protein
VLRGFLAEVSVTRFCTREAGVSARLGRCAGNGGFWWLCGRGGLSGRTPDAARPVGGWKGTDSPLAVRIRGGSTLRLVRPRPALLSRSMDASSSRYTERQETRRLRFLALEETVDHLAKGRDGLGTFDEGRLERALRTRFADEKARCAGNSGL